MYIKGKTLGHTSYFHLSIEEERSHRALENAILRAVNYAFEEEKRDRKKPTHFSILDVGSGRGEIMKILSSHKYDVQGLDIDPICVELSKRYGPCKLGTIEELDSFFPQAYFTLVIASHILEHCPNPKLAMEKMKTVSKRWILVAVPNLSNINSLIESIFKISSIANPSHLHGWNYPHLKNFLEIHCNLEIVKWEKDIIKIVRCPSTFRPIQNIYRLFTYLLRPLEMKILPTLFPFLSTSLIALCKKRRDGL